MENKELKLCSYDLYSLSSMLVTLNRPTIIIGFVITSAIAGLLAAILYVVFSKLGSQHLIVKCAAVSVLMWLALELIFTSTIEKRFMPERIMSSYYSHLTGAICFGIVEGILFRKFLFPEQYSPKEM